MRSIRTHAPLALGCVGAWLLFLMSAAAFAWGDEGHEIIGAIAEHDLRPAVRQRVQDLLATDSSGLTLGRSLAEESVWADKFRDSDRKGAQERYRGTREWHYFDLEIDASAAEAECAGHPRAALGVYAAVGPPHDCILDKIEQFSVELADTATPPKERLLALLFLMHLVGDLHQPLHVADAHDRGGNQLRVACPQTAPGNLHHYWDTVFVERLGGRYPAVAARLIAGISARERRAWSAGSARDWALQSHEIARHEVYGKLPPRNERHMLQLGPAYCAAAVETVRVQLERAGVRLAFLLNTHLAPL